ncbi:FtsX-like permease family protein [bacterium]|nr:FtsX-like permease family protein [bacterium]
MTSIHLHSKQKNDTERYGDIRQVRLFAMIAGFVLLIACINFINLATARAAGRAREVGLRKVIGAQRETLIAQFLGESFVITGIATALALLLLRMVLPMYNTHLGRELTLLGPNPTGTTAMLVGLYLLVSLLAGLYPAFYLTSFRPKSILQGEVTRGKRGARARKALVVFQFTISVALMACISVVASQMQYLRGKDLGYHRENILTFPLTDALRSHWKEQKARFENLPGVEGITASKRIPSGGLYDSPGTQVEIDGTLQWIDFSMPHVRVEPTFLDVYGVEMVAGRDFDPMRASDFTEAYVVNESAAHAMGFERMSDVLGTTVKPLGYELGQIIGVCRDFHYETLRNRIQPIIIYPSGEVNTVSIRIAGASTASTIRAIAETWESIHPGGTFDYTFLDEHLAALYHDDRRMMQMFIAFGALAVVIACLGLVGLATFAAERRRREIGVRKTLGASVQSIVGLLTGEFSVLVLLGSIVAVPIAWFGMRAWLGTFAYRIDLELWHFPAAFGAALLIALASVSWQAFRAASINPVDALRQE